MTVAEANAIIESISDNDKASWEKTRWLGYITALTQGAKLKNPTDLLKFSWEINEANSIEIKDIRTVEEVTKGLLQLMKKHENGDGKIVDFSNF